MVTAGHSGTSGLMRDSTEIFSDNVWRTITGKLPTKTNAIVAINIHNRVLLFGRLYTFYFKHTDL